MDRTGKGRLLLTSVAALTAVGGFLADWNRTHLFNPGWPAAAREVPRRADHRAGLAWAPLPIQEGEGPACRRRARGPAALAVLGGPVGELRLPRGRRVEAEFPEVVPRVKGVWVNERFFSALMLALIAAGYAAERRRRGA